MPVEAFLARSSEAREILAALSGEDGKDEKEEGEKKEFTVDLEVVSDVTGVSVEGLKILYANDDLKKLSNDDLIILS